MNAVRLATLFILSSSRDMYEDLGTTRRITGDLSVRKQIRSIADDSGHGRVDARKRGGRVAWKRKN